MLAQDVDGSLCFLFFFNILPHRLKTKIQHQSAFTFIYFIPTVQSLTTVISLRVVVDLPGTLNL